MAYDRHGYEKTEYVGQENSKGDIYGSVVEQGIYRIRTKQELWNLFEDFDVIADITKKRLEWIGHLVRMDHGKVVKKIFESKAEGRRRRMGRPRSRWLEDAAKDLCEMQVKRWRQKAVDREEWAYVIKEAKAHRAKG